jgi:hypothetical protein
MKNVINTDSDQPSTLDLLLSPALNSPATGKFYAKKGGFTASIEDASSLSSSELAVLRSTFGTLEVFALGNRFLAYK